MNLNRHFVEDLTNRAWEPDHKSIKARTTFVDTETVEFKPPGSPNAWIECDMMLNLEDNR